jgi:GTP 3',8-cyclase
MKSMVDPFGRRIEYLRISVTDKCNLRCVYCMPEEGLPWLHKQEILSYGEITEIVGPWPPWGCAASGSRAGSRSCAATSPPWWR